MENAQTNYQYDYYDEVKARRRLLKLNQMCHSFGDHIGIDSLELEKTEIDVVELVKVWEITDGSRISGSYFETYKEMVKTLDRYDDNFTEDLEKIAKGWQERKEKYSNWYA